MAGRIVDLLSERLKFEQSWKDNPDIANEKIVRPVIGIGLGSSGSNALGFVIAQDPNRRVLRSWEAHFPSPPLMHGVFELGKTYPDAKFI